MIKNIVLLIICISYNANTFAEINATNKHSKIYTGVAVAIVLASLGGVGYFLVTKSANAIELKKKGTIFVTRINNERWEFDASQKGGVSNEGLVKGTNELLDYWYRDLVNKKNPEMKVTFSDRVFDGAMDKLELLYETADGDHYYRSKVTGKQAYLCPVLKGYFPVVPQSIYVALKL